MVNYPCSLDMKLPSPSLAGKAVLILLCLFGSVGIAQAQGLFQRDLHLGDQGEDVRRLQIFLNGHGAPVAETGVGSRGRETTLYGQKTQRAVAAFQTLHQAEVLSPVKLVRGTGIFYKTTRELANALVNKEVHQVQQAATVITPAMQDSSSPNMSHQPTYAIGGTITGLKRPVLIREASGETLSVKPGDSANFVFSHPFVSGDHYQVTAVSEVAGPQLCYASANGTGTISDASVLTIQIQCTSDLLGDPARSFAGHGAQSYTLGGTVSGLVGTLVLQTGEGDSVTLMGDGSFTFGSRIQNGRSYAVTVRTNPSRPDQICTVTNGTGMIANNHVTNVAVTCDALTTTLAASVDALALSIAGLTDAPSSGSARLITITNTGGGVAHDVGVTSPTWPAGTVSNTTCGSTLASGASCTITITPGATASSDGSGACSAGTAPIPGVVQVSGDNTNAVTTNVVVLGYGCIYQEGYVFSIDDSTPITGSVGGKVAALTNQSEALVWGSNGADASTVSYDVIPGIGDTSVSTSGAPTFADFSTYFGANYAGVLGLSSGSFSACDGRRDGQCNTSNIVAFYNHYQTNYGVGPAPYTPVATSTPKSYYAAGLCDDYDSGTHQDWYLPAICEVTVDYPEIRSEVAGCGVEEHPLMQTIMKNLFFNGIGSFTLGHGIWSSSQFMYYYPETYAWNALVWPTPFPGGGDKSDLAQVRCVRSLTY